MRERILSAAYPLFVQRGIRQITREEIQRVAGVTEWQFGREFSSRDDVATECLERREQKWTAGVVEADARARGTSPEGRLLAIFDVFDEWFHRHDYEALSRVDELLHMGKDHPLGRSNAAYMLNMRHLANALAIEARLRDSDEFALSWHILVTGAIINAVEGDENAAARAKEMGRDLIARHKRRDIAQPVPVTAEEAQIFGYIDEYDFIGFIEPEADARRIPRGPGPSEYDDDRFSDEEYCATSFGGE